MADAAELVERAKAERAAGRFEDAAHLYELAVRAYDAAGEQMSGAHALRHVAELQLKLGRVDEANTSILAVLLYYRDTGVGGLERANALRVGAMAQEAAGFFVDARDLWVEAGQLYGEAGVQAGVDNAAERIAALNGK